MCFLPMVHYERWVYHYTLITEQTKDKSHNSVANNTAPKIIAVAHFWIAMGHDGLFSTYTELEYLIVLLVHYATWKKILIIHTYNSALHSAPSTSVITTGKQEQNYCPNQLIVLSNSVLHQKLKGRFSFEINYFYYIWWDKLDFNAFYTKNTGYWNRHFGCLMCVDCIALRMQKTCSIA